MLKRMNQISAYAELFKSYTDNARKIVARIQEHYQHVTIHDLLTSVSFGVATRTQPDQNLVTIMKQAEDLMYENKKGIPRTFKSSWPSLK
ncbi:MAG: diguanylate cyclase [Clostridia bacterium]|nr:diguanylate cyclase [Clostridia bacterium]